MAYALGPRARAPDARRASWRMSGFIPTVEGWDADPIGREGLPVLIAHGTLDPVIPVQFGQAARDRLTAAGADVSYRETPVPTRSTRARARAARVAGRAGARRAVLTEQEAACGHGGRTVPACREYPVRVI